MAVFSLALGRRLVASCVVAGLLVATGSTAAAATSPGSPAPSSSSAPSSASSSTPSSTPSSATPRTPNVTAPPVPTDHGPPCTTNAKAPNPVICLPEGFGEDKPASLTPGGGVAFGAQVVNNGAPVADAEVVITLPVGLTLLEGDGESVLRVDDWYEDDPADGDATQLTCQGGRSTVTCSIGRLAEHANVLLLLFLQVSTNAEPGTSLTFQVVLQPVGVPSYAPTSVSATVDVLAPSHLQVSLTPATLHTVVGHRATITGIVHNVGTGPAPDTIAVAIDLDRKHPRHTHFTITNGTDPDDGDPFGSGESGSGSDSSASGSGPIDSGGTTVVIVGATPASPVRDRAQRQVLARDAGAAGQDGLPSVRLWPLGTIAPGATVKVPIKLRALSVGTDALGFSAVSLSAPDSADADCDESAESGAGTDSDVPSATPLDRARQAVSTTSAPASCPFAVLTHITAIPRPAGTAPLADTGSRTDTELGIALWALAVGSLLVWAGRRRRSTVRRHA